MLPGQQSNVHWRLQACSSSTCWRVPLVSPFTNWGEKRGRMTSPFISVLLQSMIAMVAHDCHGCHDCAGNPWASCRGDRLVGAGQVHRKYWQCHQEVGMLPKSLMESHSSEKAPLLCFLQWSSRWLLLHPAQTVKGSPLVEFSWLQSAVPYE